VTLGRLLTRGACAAAVAAFASARGVPAQVSVHAASFRADLTAPGEATVRLSYELRGVGEGATVPLSVLDFGAAAAFDVRVDASGEPVTLARAQGAARAAEVAVDGGPRDEGWLALTYRVSLPNTAVGSVLVHLPVVTVDLPPREARAGLFEAEVLVPDGWVVSEGFPTGLSLAGVPGLGAPGSLAVELQVVPSVVSLRVRTDGAWRPGLPLLLDAVAVALLLAFSVVGWRHLRESAA
jgi:hypothetical protein